jgi:hypothetical protein
MKMHTVASEESQAYLEQALDFRNTPFIDQKQNDMIIVLDDQIVVGDQDFIATDDGTDRGTRWQIDLLNCAPNHFGALAVTMSNRFQCFSGAATQRMHGCYITTADMCKKCANGGLLG